MAEVGTLIPKEQTEALLKMQAKIVSDQAQLLPPRDKPKLRRIGKYTISPVYRGRVKLMSEAGRYYGDLLPCYAEELARALALRDAAHSLGVGSIDTLQAAMRRLEEFEFGGSQ